MLMPSQVPSAAFIAKGGATLVPICRTTPEESACCASAPVECMIASMSRTRQKRITYEARKQNIVKAHLLQQIGGPSCMANVTTF
jgi:hypothetical protein